MNDHLDPHVEGLERACRADDQPYRYPTELHRLDEEYLVLLDGMTGGVSAYRRSR